MQAPQLAPVLGGQGETEEETSHCSLAGDRVEQHGCSPTRLGAPLWVCAGRHQTNKEISAPSGQNLKSLWRGLSRVPSPILSRWSQSQRAILVSPACILETSPAAGAMGRGISQGQGGVRSLHPTAWGQLTVMSSS